MQEIFLLKLGEIVLKGQNRHQFENKLRQNVRRRMKPMGYSTSISFNPPSMWSR